MTVFLKRLNMCLILNNQLLIRVSSQIYFVIKKYRIWEHLHRNWAYDMIHIHIVIVISHMHIKQLQQHNRIKNSTILEELRVTERARMEKEEVCQWNCINQQICEICYLNDDDELAGRHTFTDDQTLLLNVTAHMK